MRITVNLSDKLGNEIKRYARSNKTSVSSVTAEALLYYIEENKRKKLGQKVLNLAGKVKINSEALKELEYGRYDTKDRP